MYNPKKHFSLGESSFSYTNDIFISCGNDKIDQPYYLDIKFNYKVQSIGIMKHNQTRLIFRVVAAGEISHFTILGLMCPCSLNTVKIHNFPSANLYLTVNTKNLPINSICLNNP